MTKDFSNYPKQYPDANGQFGPFGGSYIPPELQVEIDKITDAYLTISQTHKFIEELRTIRKHYQGRPTPVFPADPLSQMCGGAQIYLKREDLNHTGANGHEACKRDGVGHHPGQPKRPWRQRP